MLEAGSSLWPGEHGCDAAILIAALRTAGVGLAVLDRSGYVLTADERFLAAHRIEAADAVRAEAGATFHRMLTSSASGHSASDVRTLSEAWAALIETSMRGSDVRQEIGFEDGRVFELAARSVTDGPIVLTVTGVRHPDEAEQHARSRLAHDMNNIIGGMLANLHLCLADLPNDHPIRRRLETVNQSALDLRSSVRKLAAP
ncbi:hypothetical protein BAL199_02494 [alpha proteobacterium BAL199]|nr:hypothetical protein BAL199_02494 [alpha proteobacterium BAL199]